LFFPCVDDLRYFAAFLARLIPVDGVEFHAATSSRSGADFSALGEMGVAFPAGFTAGDDVRCDCGESKVGF
jgi:hypothetical protein